MMKLMRELGESEGKELASVLLFRSFSSWFEFVSYPKWVGFNPFLAQLEKSILQVSRLSIFSLLFHLSANPQIAIYRVLFSSVLCPRI
jgi:hypothetical protein